jgi:simple sugar transport system substrate-binding protein
MKLTAWILAGCMALGALGCKSEPAAPAAAKADKPLRLIFVTTLVHEEFFNPVRKGMEDAAKLMGVEATFTGTEGVDVKAQAAMVTKAVADGYDGIALNLIDPTAFDDVVKAAIDKGVPVVGFNTDDPAHNARLSSVNQNLYEAGRVFAMHDEGISALEDRCRGMTEELKAKNVSWKRFITGSDPVKAREIIAKNLKENPDTKIVLCTGQADLEPVALVIEKEFAGQGYAVAGFDLSPTILRLIEADIIKFTIDQQPYVQGYYPVIQLALYCRYGIKPSNMDAGAFVITKKDAAAVMELKKANYR